MRRRTFLSTLPAGAFLASAGAGQAQTPAPAAAAPTAPAPRARPADPSAGIGIGDRNSGVKFVGRSTVWGAIGAAATAASLLVGAAEQIAPDAAEMRPHGLAGARNVAILDGGHDGFVLGEAVVVLVRALRRGAQPPTARRGLRRSGRRNAP